MTKQVSDARNQAGSGGQLTPPFHWRRAVPDVLIVRACTRVIRHIAGVAQQRAVGHLLEDLQAYSEAEPEEQGIDERVAQADGAGDNIA